MDNKKLEKLEQEYFSILGQLRDDETQKDEVNGDYVALIDSITNDEFISKLFRFE